MKRKIPLLILPFLLGIAAAWLRANELLFSVNPITGLPDTRLWISGALTALTLVTCVTVILAVMFMPKVAPSPSHSPALPAAGGVSFAILFVFAFFLLYGFMQSRQITSLISGVLTLLSSCSFLLLSLKHFEMRESGLYNTLAAIPTFWACYSLILIFRQRISDPIISDYIHLLMAFICILLFVYALCGYVFGKNRIRLAAICAPIGIFFCAIELFAPLFAQLILPGAEILHASFSESGPLAAMLVFMPFALDEILRNSNRIEM